MFVIFFLALHVPLALMASSLPAIAVAHALGTLALGLTWAGGSDHAERVAYVAAYIAGAEVFWRMTGGAVVWEYGKYSTSAIFLLWMFRKGWPGQRFLPVLYFLLLLPSVVLTLLSLDGEEARQQISFNLSGPFALMVAACFFSGTKLSRDQLLRAFLALIGPILAIGTITLVSTIGEPSVQFTGESNLVTSGGMAPNQVSAALGLGSLVAFFCALDKRLGRIRFIMFGLTIFFAAESALTFSRSGLFYASAAIATAIILLVKDVRQFTGFILATLLIAALGTQVLVPRLNEYTGGALVARFQNTDPTGRDLLVRADLETWRENPVFGVGPGMSLTFHEFYFGDVTAHTEFSRLPAEHGIFGIAALFLLFVLVAQNFARARGTRARAFAGAFIVWGFFFMLGSAMRIVAPALMLGITFATLVLDGEPSSEPKPKPHQWQRRDLTQAWGRQTGGMNS